MKKELNVFFGAFSNSSFSDESVHKNNNTNTKLLYDQNKIDFISNKGDKFNLKFKNSIEDVLVISDGVIVKFTDSSDNLDFFHNARNRDSSSYLYYLITHHPLNNICSLGVLSNENIQKINIIKTSSDFPFVISKNEDNQYKFYLLLLREQKALQDFNNYLQKMMYNSLDPFNVSSEHYTLSSNDSRYSLLYLSDFQVESDFVLSDLNIYSNFSEKKSVFFSFFDSNKNKVYNVQFKFKSNDSFSFVKSVYCFNDVMSVKKVDSLLSKDNQEELFEKSKKSNRNMIINYLQKKHLFGVKNKTLCFLDVNRILNYVEGTKVFMRVDLGDYVKNVNRRNKICDFRVINHDEFAFSFIDEESEEKIKLNFNLNDQYVLNYIKYFKKFLFNSKDLFSFFIEDIFQFFLTYANTTNNNSKFLLFLDYLLLVFSTVCKNNNSGNTCNNGVNGVNGINIPQENQSNLTQSQLLNYNKEDLEDVFPLISDNLLKSFNRQENFFFTSEYNNNNINDNNNSCSINSWKDFINKDLLEYFYNNKDIIISSLAHFSFIYYEKLIIQNYYEKIKDTILNFLVKLLVISDKYNLLFQYTKSLSESYGNLKENAFLNNPLNREKFLYNMFSFPPQHETFFEYLKSTIILNIKDKQITIYPSTYFNSMKNQIVIFNLINNKSLSNEIHRINEREVFLSQDYNLFLRKGEEERSQVFNNFLCVLINSDMDVAKIKMMHPFLSITILNEISKYKINPYPILTEDKHLNAKLLELVDRLDLAKNLGNDHALDIIEEDKNITFLLYENQSSNYEADYYITNIKFNEDTRFKEALRITNPSRVIKVNTSSLSVHNESSRLEIEKFNLMVKNLIREYSAAVGFGAINLNTIKTFPKDILSIKSLNLKCVSSTDETSFKLDMNSDLVKDKEFLKWPEFHNGVSHALKLSTENFTNKSYIRNWILFNKPNLATFEHGGFLLGIGLLKQLDSLYSTDIYQYMKTAHDGITIGILLGRAASQISTMEESLSRTLCLHIAYLIPSTLELSISINIQCAASVGLGLLYLGTGNRLMTEMLLNQIGRKFTGDKNMNISHIESYNLCLGFSIGLINLGLGKVNVNEDLRLEAKLLNFANGGKKIENNTNCKFKSDDKFNNNSIIFPIKKTNQTYIEEFEINSNLTSDAAYACLTLIYLQSNNTQIASKIKIPSNLFQLDSFKPFHLYLAILTKNLIQWDNIHFNAEWIFGQIPDYIKFLYEEKLCVISEDVTYASMLNSISFSQISTSYHYAIAAGLMSLGFKFAGSNNKQVSTLIITFINKFKKVKVVSDIIVRDQTKYDDNNKYYLNKNTLDQCLCISAYALAIIMAGSGDMETFKILRVLRKKLESDVKSLKYGFDQAIHHAIGMLFLGAGALTFAQTKQSLAFLYISTFPIFASSTNCNEKYLQAFRHLYVLSCDNKILETRDIDSGLVVRTNIEIEYNDDKKVEITTPSNVEDYTKIKKFELKSSDHYYVQSELSDIVNNSNTMFTKTIYIKKRVSYDDQIIEQRKFFPSLNKLHSEFDLRILKGLIKELREKVKDYITTVKDNLNIDIISSIIVDQSNDAQVEEENHYNKYSLMINKNSLLLLVEFLKNDKLNSFFILNDYLVKLLKSLEEGLLNFEVFNFFFYLNSKEKNSNNTCEKIIYEEICQIITEYVKILMKENFKKFFENFISDKLTDDYIMCNLENILHIFSSLNLFQIKYESLKKNEGNFFTLLSDIKSYMNRINIQPNEMKKLIKNLFNTPTRENLITLDEDFQNYLLTSICSISGNDYTIPIYLIEIFLDVLIINLNL